MNNLQQYLNNLENKQEIKEINLTQIQQERENNGESELLQGGELDLREFTNLEKVEIDPKLLKTPLTKLNVDGLTHLKELDWLESKEDSPEQKQLWTELGIENENEKKEVVKEVNRLAEIKKVKVNFSGEEKEGQISLSLDKKDKQDNFCPSLVFWNFAWELARNKEETKTSQFWKQLENELDWVKRNLIEEYQKEFSNLLIPSTFPTEKLEISELLSVYYPNSEKITDEQIALAKTDKEIVDKTWQTLKEKVLELISQELSKNPGEEELPKLATKLRISYQDEYYIIQTDYHQEAPFKTSLEQLITDTPLKLEIEHLKEQKDQLPTAENWTKITKKAQALENYLQDLMSEEEYEKIKAEIDKIN